MSYVLPAISDPENDSCLVAIISSPAYVVLSGTTLAINPPLGTASGNYPVILNINDGINTPQFNFNVIVSTNSLPVFVTMPVD